MLKLPMGRGAHVSSHPLKLSWQVRVVRNVGLRRWAFRVFVARPAQIAWPEKGVKVHTLDLCCRRSSPWWDVVSVLFVGPCLQGLDISETGAEHSDKGGQSNSPCGCNHKYQHVGRLETVLWRIYGLLWPWRHPYGLWTMEGYAVRVAPQFKLDIVDIALSDAVYGGRVGWSNVDVVNGIPSDPSPSVPSPMQKC